MYTCMQDSIGFLHACAVHVTGSGMRIGNLGMGLTSCAYWVEYLSHSVARVISATRKQKSSHDRSHGRSHAWEKISTHKQ